MCLCFAMLSLSRCRSLLTLTIMTFLILIEFYNVYFTLLYIKQHEREILIYLFYEESPLELKNTIFSKQ